MGPLALAVLCVEDKLRKLCLCAQGCVRHSCTPGLLACYSLASPAVHGMGAEEAGGYPSTSYTSTLSETPGAAGVQYQAVKDAELPEGVLEGVPQLPTSSPSRHIYSGQDRQGRRERGWG